MSSASTETSTCFASHHYGSGRSEEKNQKKPHARYMAEVYRKKLVKYVNCALALDEYDRLKTHAEKAGRKPTTHLRESALAYMRQQYLVPKDLKEQIGNLTALLRNIAGNLNQIAKRTNHIQKLTVIDALHARSLVLKLETAIKRFINHPPKMG